MEVTWLIWEYSLALTPDSSRLPSSQLDQLLLTSRQFQASWARNVCSSATGLTLMQLPAGWDRTRAKTPAATSAEVWSTTAFPSTTFSLMGLVRLLGRHYRGPTTSQALRKVQDHSLMVHPGTFPRNLSRRMRHGARRRP
jgi:hypothetical protein